jgi:hypothetical protein
VANPPPGTNSAGTAQSSGGSTTTGSALGPRTDDDRAIDREDQVIDRKVKGICKGC